MIENIYKYAKNINLNIVINYLIILYAFSLPISKAGTTLFGILLILFWLVEGNFRDKFLQLKSNPFISTLGLFVTFSIVALFWSSDTSFAVDYIRKYWHLLIIPVIFTSLDMRYLKYIFSAFLLGMLISEIVSYGIFFELWTKEGVSPSDPSPFMDHTNYSIYLAFTVFILLHRIIYVESFKWKVMYGMYMLLSMSNMLINGGRTGQVAFFVTLVVVALINTKHKLRAILGSVMAGVVIFISAYNISPVFHDRMNYTYYDIKKMITEQNFTNSMSIRVSLWIMGTHVFLENPILGTGIGDEAKNMQKYIDKYDFSSYDGYDGKYIDYHNAFVQYAAQLGIVGFILFVTLFITLFKLKFKSLVYRNLNITFVCLYILLSTVGLSLHIMASMVLFGLFTGIFNAISRYETTHDVELYHMNK